LLITGGGQLSADRVIGRKAVNRKW